MGVAFAIVLLESSMSINFADGNSRQCSMFNDLWRSHWSEKCESQRYRHYSQQNNKPRSLTQRDSVTLEVLSVVAVRVTSRSPPLPRQREV
jgi:hypothetical protein